MGKKDDAIAAVHAAAGTFVDGIRTTVEAVVDVLGKLTVHYVTLGNALYDAAIERGDIEFARKVFRAAVESVVKAKGYETAKGTEGAKILDRVTRMAGHYADKRAGMLDSDSQPTEEPTEEAAAAGFKPRKKKGTAEGDPQPENTDPMDSPIRENIGHATGWLSVALLQLQAVTTLDSLTADDIIAVTALDKQVMRFVEWLRSDPTGSQVAEKIIARLEFEATQVAA